MVLDRLIALLPCQSVEDLDLKRQDDDANQVLSAWSSLWRPELLNAAEGLPAWAAASEPPLEPAAHLIIVPDCSLPLLPEGWLADAEKGGAHILRNLRHRDEMVAAALACLAADAGSSRHNATVSDAELAADFLALGYCHLLVELVTRKLRYSSNLDEVGLRTAALAAAKEAMAGNVAAARGHLQAAFDRLHEAREYYYPVDTRLLDLTLLAQGAFGEALRSELISGVPRNVLCSGDVLQEMAKREPETVACLKQALTDGRAALIGGEFIESRLPLLEPEAIARQLRLGQAAYRQHLGQHATIFGRRRFGLTPVLPQLLDRLGFTAAFHCTLDDGRFPTGNQDRTQWEGLDGTMIDAISAVPLDAGRAGSFLELAEKLGDSLSVEQSSTVVLAHWPGRACVWYDDLRRIAAYGSVLGKFSTMADCFQQTDMYGRRAQYKPDDYRSPYLRQDVAAGRRDPISRWVRYFRREAALEACRTLGVMASCVASGRLNATDQALGEDERLTGVIEDVLAGDESASAALDEQLAELTRQSLASFAGQVAGARPNTDRGCMVVNPWSFAQRSHVSADFGIDAPAMGFAWRSEASETPAPQAAKRRGWFRFRRRTTPPLAEEHLLRNDFCEVLFDPHTGAIRSISDYHSRDPRVGQQIALRLPRGRGGEADYSIMAADELVVTSTGPMLGEMVCRGRLMDPGGQRVAGFKQTTRLWRGSRVVELLIELDIERQPEPNPWESYYAMRFAWKDENAELRRSVNLASVPTELTQLESPHFLDIRRGKQRTTLLFGGLPYHRRFGRKLDTLLVATGETARSFRLGIGVDLPHPMATAMGFIAPPLVLPNQPAPPAPTGWLFHLDCPNVLATHWESLPAEDVVVQASRLQSVQPGRPHHNTGFRVRLLETEGRGVRLGLRSFRAVAAAQKINAGDVPPVDLAVEGDRVEVPIGPYQWVEAEVRFQ